MSKSKKDIESSALPSYNECFKPQFIPPCEPPPYTPQSNLNQTCQQQLPNVPSYPSNVTVYAPNVFDSGARFDMSRPLIPPPPPGVAPNAAQLAAMQGHNIVVTQRKPNFWFGSEDF